MRVGIVAFRRSRSLEAGMGWGMRMGMSCHVTMFNSARRGLWSTVDVIGVLLILVLGWLPHQVACIIR